MPEYVKNQPFSFLSSATSVTALIKALEPLGLLPIGDISQSHSSLIFRSLWLSDPIELRWTYRWWPCGTVREDDTITVIHGVRVLAQIDVSRLLGQQLPASLRSHLIDLIVDACQQASGKTRRPRS